MKPPRIRSRHQALGACVAGSLLLHVWLLAPAATRLTQGHPGVHSIRATGSTGIGRPVAARVTQHAAASTISDPPRQPHRSLRPAMPPDLETLPPTAAGPQTAQTGGGLDGDHDDAGTYLPRSALSRVPEPLQPIDLSYPETAPSGRYRAVLTLFIDERGQVQRVRIDAADATGLPTPLEDSARLSFLSGRFTPGEADGRPVRSQMRIEVEFATESIDDLPAPTDG